MITHFSHSEQLALTLFTFYFKPEKPLHFVAGQFIELYLPHLGVDARGDKRWFTLSSAPHEPLLAITTNSGVSSFKRALFSLKSDDGVNISAPLGDFVLPKNQSIPLLFIAGGIGATPYRSILIDSFQRNESRDIQMLYTARSQADVLFLDTFQQLGNSFKEHISVSERTYPDLNSITPDHYVYVAGPEQMVEATVTYLVTSNIKRSQIFTDFFHGYADIN